MPEKKKGYIVKELSDLYSKNKKQAIENATAKIVKFKWSKELIDLFLKDFLQLSKEEKDRIKEYLSNGNSSEDISMMIEKDLSIVEEYVQ